MTTKAEIIDEFGLTSQLEIMKASIRVAMAKEILRDIEADKFDDSDKEILRQGAMRLLENNDLTGLQRSLRQKHYFDAQAPKHLE